MTVQEKDVRTDCNGNAADASVQTSPNDFVSFPGSGPRCSPGWREVLREPTVWPPGQTAGPALQQGSRLSAGNGIIPGAGRGGVTLPT